MIPSIPPLPKEGDNKYLIDINKDNLARVIAFVNVYDGKAKFVFTMVLALTAYLLAELPSYIDIHATHPSEAWFVLLDLLLAGCLSFFIWAAVLVILTIRPDTVQHSQKASSLFFQSIAMQPLEEFRAMMGSLDEAKAVDLLAEQTYDNAKVVSRKHARVREAINRFLAGMVLFFLFTIGRAILLALTR